jgi:hypothetical protein
MKSIHNNWRVIIVVCLSLGLAQFFPEQHLWRKIKRLAGGAKDMDFQDWF